MKNLCIRQSGFTLPEVLVGMALLGIVLVMIFTGLHTTSRSWESGVRQAQENDDYRLVLSFIRREINETIPIIYLDSNNRHVIFRGERNSLQFVSRLPAHRGGAGLYLVAFDITKDKGMSSTSINSPAVLFFKRTACRTTRLR